MITGACHCQSVKYEIHGDIKKIVNCHCQLCRGMNGAAFSTYAVALQSDFKLVAGELAHFNVTDNATKHFCPTCGTAIFNRNAKLAGLNMLYFGTIQAATAMKPDVNVFCESKLDWLAQVLDAPCFEQGIA
ncbi:GFA family protein [Motilimonas sp. KMU-193]|uniref:GFA family protein n=1 Tax=Motilimonas sp. KMU-193 TaxID=3388668 RepID=UPI00396B44A8